MKNQFIISVSIIFIVTLSSCVNKVSNSKIGEYLSKNCIKNDCEIDLVKVIEINWDTVYFFDQSSSLKFINQTLHTNYDFVDVGRKIIFKEGNQIVYSEDEFPNPEMTKKNEILFSIGVNTAWKFSRNDAKFIITRERNYFYIKHKP